MLKTIIGKLEFLFYFFFKLIRFTHNPKVELKRLWVGLDSGTNQIRGELN